MVLEVNLYQLQKKNWIKIYEQTEMDMDNVEQIDNISKIKTEKKLCLTIDILS